MQQRKLTELLQEDYALPIIKELGMRQPTETSIKKYRYAEFECSVCNKPFETQTRAVKLKPKGKVVTMCKQCSMDMNKDRNKSHGLSKTHPLYNTWLRMKQRCNNPKAKGYELYGGRGIKVYAKWEDSFTDWVEYLESLPSYQDKLNNPEQKYTIDRIDNAQGYEPGNMRWATQTVQNHNQKKNKRNTSGYTGVGYVRATNKWQAVFQYAENRHIAVFVDKEHAAMQYDLWAIKYKSDRKLNKPELIEEYSRLNPDTFHDEMKKLERKSKEIAKLETVLAELRAT